MGDTPDWPSPADGGPADGGPAGDNAGLPPARADVVPTTSHDFASTPPDGVAGRRVLGFILAGCIAAAGLTVGAAYLYSEFGEPAVDEDEPSTATSERQDSGPRDTERSAQAAEPVETLAEQLERVELAVERLRELDDIDGASINVVSYEQLADQVSDEIQTELDPDELDIDDRMLTVMGWLGPEANWEEELLAAYTSQVAGYYQTEDDELFIPSTRADEALRALDEVTLAHEILHSLTDATLGIVDPDDDAPSDQIAAYTAIVEGDAQLVTQLYVADQLSPGDILSLLTSSIGAIANVEEFPAPIQEQLLFPYDEGFAFVADVQADGGWAAVNDLYANPPTSTRQILFPALFVDGEDDEVVRPPEPPAGWAEVRTDTFGALDLRSHARLYADTATQRPELDEDRLLLANTGGQIAVWTRGEDTAAWVGLASGTNQGAAYVCGTMRRLVEAVAGTVGGESDSVALTGGAHHVVACDVESDAQTTLLMGSSADVVDEVLQALLLA